MHMLTRRIALPLFALFVGSAGFAVGARADDAMKPDAMSSDAMKADCVKQAGMETDAMKKKDMLAACDKDAMSGDSMKSNDSMKSDDAMAPKK